jgi:hypothetical protein
MAEFTCPQCHAEIHADLIETTGRAECPFCGADLSSLGLPEAVEESVAPGTKYVPPTDPGGERRELPPLPPKSRIRVVESSAERLVLYIPGGGTAAVGIGCFAFFWNVFMVVFTSISVFGAMGGGKGNAFPELGLAAFLCLFWAVGLGMAWFWMRMKFERTFLLAERQRLVLQKVLFNRKRVDQAVLTRESRAELVESYQQNDQPVYRIEVRGRERTVKFGTSLSDAEKDWLVDRLNDFFAIGAAANSDDATTPTSADPTDDGDQAAGLAEPPLPSIAGTRLTAADLPSECAIRVVLDSPAELRFCLAAAQNRTAKWVVAGFCLLFSLCWYGFILGDLLKNLHEPAGPFAWIQILFALFLVPFLVAGLFPLGFGLMALFGAITVHLTRETLSCRWSLGPIGWTKRLPTAAISLVRVESGDNRNSRTRQTGRTRGNQTSQRACIVWAGDKRIPLTLLHDDDVMVQVAMLVRTKLNEMGYKLRDA